MKILFDQGTPAPLRRVLAGHAIFTAFEQGWSNLQNGDLIQVAETEGFQAFRDRKLAILVLPTTSWPKIQKYLDKVSAAVNALAPGDYRELDFGG